MAGEMKKPWSNEARAVDHHSDDVSPCFSESPVKSPGRRGQCIVNPNQAKVAAETLDELLIHGGM
jgi:hypothetical protein